MTFNEANKENVEKSRLIHEGLLDPTDYEKKYTLLRKYLTRGGFIKDRNGKWCKDGDKVEFETEELMFDGILEYDEEQNLFYIHYDDDFYSVLVYQFWLLEPCEPDICKNFEEV